MSRLSLLEKPSAYIITDVADIETVTGTSFSVNDDFFSYVFSVSLAHWMDERQKVYKARQRRVETICQKFNVATFSSNDTMEDLINQSVHNDSASGNERLCEFIINKIFVKIAPLLLVYVLTTK